MEENFEIISNYLISQRLTKKNNLGNIFNSTSKTDTL